MLKWDFCAADPHEYPLPGAQPEQDFAVLPGSSKYFPAVVLGCKFSFLGSTACRATAKAGTCLSARVKSL